MKSLEKERSRRYETANGLARDIERFLNDEAVEACPPSMWYRTRKLARKYKYPLIAAGTGFCVLSASVIGTSYGLRKALLAERAESIERAKAVQARTEAEWKLTLPTCLSHKMLSTTIDSKKLASI